MTPLPRVKEPLHRRREKRRNNGAKKAPPLSDARSRRNLQRYGRLIRSQGNPATKTAGSINFPLISRDFSQISYFQNNLVVFLVISFYQVWKQKLEQMGARVEDQLSKKVTHVFAANSNAILQQVDNERLKHFTGVSNTFFFVFFFLF